MLEESNQNRFFFFGLRVNLNLTSTSCFSLILFYSQRYESLRSLKVVLIYIESKKSRNSEDYFVMASKSAVTIKSASCLQWVLACHFNSLVAFEGLPIRASTSVGRIYF